MSSNPIQAQREERERDRDVTQAELAQMAEDGDVELLREIIESELSSGSIHVLDNYLSQDFILSNLNSAEVHEFKYKLQARVQMAIWAHPRTEGLHGKARAFYLSDKSASLPALSDYQQQLIHAYADGIWFRAKRSEAGWQQEEIRKTTNVVERRSNDDDGGDSLGGLL